MHFTEDEGKRVVKRGQSNILTVMIMLALAVSIITMLRGKIPEKNSSSLVVEPAVGSHGGKDWSQPEGASDVTASPSQRPTPFQAVAAESPEAHAINATPAPTVTSEPSEMHVMNATSAPTVASEPSEVHAMNVTSAPIVASEPPGAQAVNTTPILIVTHKPSEVPVVSSAPVPTARLVPENITGLKEELQDYISEQNGKYGLYFKSLVTDEAFGINDRDEYIAASTTKLPMNLLLYKRVAAGEVDLNSKLVYQKEDYEQGTGIIQNSSYGTEYTIRETSRLSIVNSDNCGINMIIRLLGIDTIRKYMQELGGTVYYGNEHRSCPYDLAIYTEELYRFYQKTPEVAGLLIEDLQNTQWNDRINKHLPDDVKVSHKIGNFPGVYNDVGIVFANEPYVLAIMSDGTNLEVASEVIAEMSKRIYDYIEN